MTAKLDKQLSATDLFGFCHGFTWCSLTSSQQSGMDCFRSVQLKFAVANVAKRAVRNVVSLEVEGC